MDATQRFSDRVENYVKYRPSYPAEVLKNLSDQFGLTAEKTVADIGAGTGILTELFLKNGNTVFAVEPNDAMRGYAEKMFADNMFFKSINGTAEHTSLEDSSMDVIVAAQAFHWFKQEEAKEEFKRIAKPDALVVLIWNDRQIRTPFEMEYENLLLEYGTDYALVNHRNINEEQLLQFYSPQKYEVLYFPNKQVFDFEGVKGRLLSSSYISKSEGVTYNAMLQKLQNIFDAHAQNGTVDVNYLTTVFIGKIK